MLALAITSGIKLFDAILKERLKNERLASDIELANQKLKEVEKSLTQALKEKVEELQKKDSDYFSQ